MAAVRRCYDWCRSICGFKPRSRSDKPLISAIYDGNAEFAKYLLHNGEQINSFDEEGLTLLMLAVLEDRNEMVQLLITEGADVNLCSLKQNALTLAAGNGSLEIVIILLRAGSDINLGMPNALMAASIEGHLHVVKFLLYAGADVSVYSENKETAFTYACEKGHTDIAELLYRQGSDIEHVESSGLTGLMLAAKEGHFATVQMLLANGAAINKTSKSGATALSLAILSKNCNIVELLSSYEANSRRLKEPENAHAVFTNGYIFKDYRIPDMDEDELGAELVALGEEITNDGDDSYLNEIVGIPKEPELNFNHTGEVPSFSNSDVLGKLDLLNLGKYTKQEIQQFMKLVSDHYKNAVKKLVKVRADSGRVEKDLFSLKQELVNFEILYKNLKKEPFCVFRKKAIKQKIAALQQLLAAMEEVCEAQRKYTRSSRDAKNKLFGYFNSMTKNM